MGEPGRDVVVIGGGGHAKVLVSILRRAGWSVLGYTDLEDRGLLLGARYIGDDTVLLDLSRSGSVTSACLGRGKVSVSTARLRLLEEIEGRGFVFPVIVSPAAVVNEGVEMGAGTVVFHGAVVNADARIGRACILNSNCTVEHDCVLGDDVHVAPGATISGGTTIGSGCMIGAGAVVIQGLHIVADSLIGAGAVVVADIEEPGMYVGNPARPIR